MVEALASDAQLLERIESFCEAQDMAPSTFGRLAIGDAALVIGLRGGRSLTLKTARRILDFIAAQEAGAEAA